MLKCSYNVLSPCELQRPTFEGERERKKVVECYVTMWRWKWQERGKGGEGNEQHTDRKQRARLSNTIQSFLYYATSTARFIHDSVLFFNSSSLLKIDQMACNNNSLYASLCTHPSTNSLRQAKQQIIKRNKKKSVPRQLRDGTKPNNPLYISLTSWKFATACSWAAEQIMEVSQISLDSLETFSKHTCAGTKQWPGGNNKSLNHCHHQCVVGPGLGGGSNDVSVQGGLLPTKSTAKSRKSRVACGRQHNVGRDNRTCLSREHCYFITFPSVPTPGSARNLLFQGQG